MAIAFPPPKPDVWALAMYSGRLHHYFGARILNDAHCAVVVNILVVAREYV